MDVFRKTATVLASLIVAAAPAVAHAFVAGTIEIAPLVAVQPTAA